MILWKTCLISEFGLSISDCCTEQRYKVGRDSFCLSPKSTIRNPKLLPVFPPECTDHYPNILLYKIEHGLYRVNTRLYVKIQCAADIVMRTIGQIKLC